MSHPVMDPARDAQQMGDGGANRREERGHPSLDDVMRDRGSAAASASPERTWPGLVDALEATISGLREQLGAYDPAATMPAHERHELERALDRYSAATDALTHHVDRILRSAAPRPRR
jgi:hypothetical protein